jgi:hypothetical protein
MAHHLSHYENAIHRATRRRNRALARYDTALRRWQKRHPQNENT